MVNDFLPSLDAYSCSLLINTRTARKAISWNSYCMLSSLLQSKPLWDSWFQSSNVSVPRHLVRSTGAGRVRPTDARRARSLVLFVQTVWRARQDLPHAEWRMRFQRRVLVRTI